LLLALLRKQATWIIKSVITKSLNCFSSISLEADFTYEFGRCKAVLRYSAIPWRGGKGRGKRKIKRKGEEKGEDGRGEEKGEDKRKKKRRGKRRGEDRRGKRRGEERSFTYFKMEREGHGDMD